MGRPWNPDIEDHQALADKNLSRITQESMATLVPHSALAKLIGEQVIESTAASVRDLIDEIRSRVGAQQWEKVKRAAILVNGRNICRLEGIDTPLGPQDRVWMVVPSAGG